MEPLEKQKRKKDTTGTKRRSRYLLMGTVSDVFPYLFRGVLAFSQPQKTAINTGPSNSNRRQKKTHEELEKEASAGGHSVTIVY